IRQYILSVYMYMALALVITAITSVVFVSSITFINLILNSPLKWILALTPVVMVLCIGKITQMSKPSALISLSIFAALIGLSLSSIFLILTNENIVSTFLTIATTFTVISIYGYITKKNLSSISSFLLMGIIGIIIANVINLFFEGSKLQFIMSVIGVIIFTLFTAYDTKRIRNIYYKTRGNEIVADKLAIYGALLLYTDFINLFVRRLQLIGARRN
ncbi:MAG: Bax inhibitor-1/YccA family protein, partial [Alphaproteobacteria bacterium]